MLEYKTVVARDSFALDKYVNRKIAEGWKLLGGVSVSVTHHANSGTEYVYAQAMTREVKQQPLFTGTGEKG